MRLLLAILFVVGATPVFAIDLDGQIDFSQRLVLNSSVSARVQRINVAVGQQVAPGELLLVLDTISLQANADQASAEVDALTPGVERMLTPEQLGALTVQPMNLKSTTRQRKNWLQN